MKNKRNTIILFLCVLCVLCGSILATQVSFNSGRLGPLLKYRVDVDKRSMGAEQMDNIIVKQVGMAYRRPGTEYIDDANDTVNIRLIPFEYSTDDAYVLEFGDDYIGLFRTTQ